MVRFNRVFKGIACLGIITIFLGCAGKQNPAGTGQYVDDSVITTRVKTAIFRDETLKTMPINVETIRAAVQLSGFADSLQNVDKAEEVASRVEGVVSVENDLVVKTREF